jgi:hypothetical protein
VIYVSNFNCHCFAVLSCCICALFWRLTIPGGSQNRDYIKNQYIPRLTDEHMFVYFSINRGIYGHVARARGAVYSSTSRNIKLYIYRLYIPWRFCRLTEEYKLDSLV